MKYILYFYAFQGSASLTQSYLEKFNNYVKIAYMENKRSCPRISSNIIVSFCKSNSNLVTGSRIKDISETGLCMPFNLFYEVDYTFEIGIPFGEYKTSIITHARVARITEQKNGRYRFDVGLEFVNMTSVKRQILRNYIQRFLPQAQNQNAQLR